MIEDVSGVTLAFQKRDQNVGPLKEAAYRLLGVGTCVIESTEDSYVCRLEPSSVRKGLAVDLRSRFIELVTDENLREKLAVETRDTRNLILALAFGALAIESDNAEAA